MISKSIDCSFSIDDENGYSCINANLILQERGSVNSVNGTHFPNFDNSLVWSLRLMSETMNFIPQGIFKLFPNIGRLIVYRFNLVDISSGDFYGANKLSDIILNTHHFKTLSPNLFAGTEQLDMIELRQNFIYVINKDAFQGLTTVTKLFLDFNFITNLHKDTFKDLIELEYIGLMKNDLKAIDKDLFKYNIKLKNINLRNNQIYIASPDMYNNQKEIIEINMKNNFCINSKYPSQPRDVLLRTLSNCLPENKAEIKLIRCIKLARSYKNYSEVSITSLTNTKENLDKQIILSTKLNTTIENLLAKIINFEIELNNTKTNNMELQVHVTNLKSEIEMLKSDYENKTRMIQHSTSDVQVKNIQDKIERLIKDYQFVANQKEAAEIKLEIARREIDICYNNLEKQKQDTLKCMKNITSHSKKLSQSITNLNVSLSSEKIKFMNCYADVKEKEHLVNELEDQLDSQTKQKQVWKNNLKNLSVEMSELKKSYLGCKADLDSSEEMIEKMSLMHKNDKVDLDNFEDLLDERDDEIIKLKQTIKNLQTSSDNLNDQNENYKIQLNDCNEDFNNLDEKNKNLTLSQQNDINSLQEMVTLLTQRNENYKTMNDKNIAEAENLRTKNYDCIEQLNERDNVLKDSTNSIENLEQELNKLNGTHIKSINDGKQLLETETNEKERCYEKLQQQHNEHDISNSQLLYKLKELQSNNESLDAKCEICIRNLENVKQENEKCFQNLNKIKRELNVKLQNVKELNTNFSNCEISNEKFLEKIQNLDKFNLKMESLNKEKEICEEKLKLENENSIMSKKLLQNSTNVRKTIVEMTEKLQQCENGLKNSQIQIENLHQDIVKCVENIASTEASSVSDLAHSPQDPNFNATDNEGCLKELKKKSEMIEELEKIQKCYDTTVENGGIKKDFSECQQDSDDCLNERGLKLLSNNLTILNNSLNKFTEEYHWLQNNKIVSCIVMSVTNTTAGKELEEEFLKCVESLKNQENEVMLKYILKMKVEVYEDGETLFNIEYDNQTDFQDSGTFQLKFDSFAKSMLANVRNIYNHLKNSLTGIRSMDENIGKISDHLNYCAGMMEPSDVNFNTRNLDNVSVQNDETSFKDYDLNDLKSNLDKLNNRVVNAMEETTKLDAVAKKFYQKSQTNLRDNCHEDQKLLQICMTNLTKSTNEFNAIIEENQNLVSLSKNQEQTIIELKNDFHLQIKLNNSQSNLMLCKRELAITINEKLTLSNELAFVKLLQSKSNSIITACEEFNIKLTNQMKELNDNTKIGQLSDANKLTMQYRKELYQCMGWKKINKQQITKLYNQVQNFLKQSNNEKNEEN